MEIAPRVFWGTIAVAFGVGLGIFGNPWLTTSAAIVRTVVYVETAGAALWLFRELRRARQRSPMPPAESSPPPVAATGWLVFGAIAVLWLILFRERFLHPALPIGDDAHYLRDSADWPTTRKNLFAPYNEHTVVPARLLTFAAIETAALLDIGVHIVMAAATLALFLTSLMLVYWFARGWWASDAGGLLTVAVFAIATNYREVILWYSASQWLFSFCLLQVGLVLATRNSVRGDRWTEAAGMIPAFCGPFAYTVGVLVGPLCSLYRAARQPSGRAGGWRAVLAPTIGTAAAVPVVAAILWSWFGTETYANSGGRGPQAFSPGDGTVYILRLSVDLLILRNLGFPTVTPERSLIWLLPLAAAAIVGLLRWRPGLWRLWPHVALVYLPYACTIPFRTWVDYGILTSWTRYQLFPQLGVALLVSGTVRELAPAWLQPSRRLAFREGLAITLLAVILLARQEGLAQ